MHERCFYYLKDKKIIRTTNVREWAKEFEKNRMVAQDRVNNSFISTVFLGIDHNYSGQGKPLLFETMVFGGELDEEQMRYSSWDEAVDGHAFMISKVTHDA